MADLLIPDAIRCIACALPHEVDCVMMGLVCVEWHRVLWAQHPKLCKGVVKDLRAACLNGDDDTPLAMRLHQAVWWMTWTKSMPLLFDNALGPAWFFEDLGYTQAWSDLKRVCDATRVMYALEKWTGDVVVGLMRVENGQVYESKDRFWNGMKIALRCMEPWRVWDEVELRRGDLVLEGCNEDNLRWLCMHENKRLWHNLDWMDIDAGMVT